MATLLIVEDDRTTSEAVCEYMQALGHQTYPAYDGECALELAGQLQIDLVILDIMLPKLGGTDVLRELRKKSPVPVLMLTAIDDEQIQADSFDWEADDYMTKPFSMVLLGKRVTALLRRCGKLAALKRMQFGEVTVNFDGYTAHTPSGQIDITPKEVELLKLFVDHKGIVLSRTQILDDLWGFDSPILDRTIDSYVKNLRKKLGLAQLVTVKGVGYKFEDTL